MNAFINAITDPRLLFLWFCFIFLALASLLLGMVEHWPWGAIFFVMGPVTLLALDMAHDESIAGKANGGPFHHFFIFVFFFGAVGLIVLTVLTAFGVLQGDTTPWTPETNFASWYIASGSPIVLVLATRTDPKDGAPDLQRMEQLDRRSTRMGVVTAAIFAVLCLVVPLISLSATSYDSLALALTLLLTPWFLYLVCDGLFYLHHPHFEEGSEGYRTLRVVCVGMVGMSCCISLLYMINTLNRSEWLPALLFAVSMASTGWSVKDYVTVGITIKEKDKEDPEAEPAAD
ncbi:hypothetical protein HMPREF2999_04070 [Rothia sp. HMSC066H02]|jgi:hypothetical protein|uniref:hypothetical protein n=1 Tax=Rothia TaxID=32207 RepID=UPI0008A11EB8|nr:MULTISPECIES: hypothetical protein [Rothia]OFO94495.1 hypothetical protein HMPREF3008_03775 [Rothia sp. HMSC065D09]OFP12198.1 hypothetical protein HMPREF2999_04070 [Rothia sp. HMSC066H02]